MAQPVTSIPMEPGALMSLSLWNTRDLRHLNGDKPYSLNFDLWSIPNYRRHVTLQKTQPRSPAENKAKSAASDTSDSSAALEWSLRQVQTLAREWKARDDQGSPRSVAQAVALLLIVDSVLLVIVCTHFNYNLLYLYFIIITRDTEAYDRVGLVGMLASTS